MVADAEREGLYECFAVVEGLEEKEGVTDPEPLLEGDKLTVLSELGEGEGREEADSVNAGEREESTESET